MTDPDAPAFPRPRMDLDLEEGMATKPEQPGGMALAICFCVLVICLTAIVLALILS